MKNKLKLLAICHLLWAVSQSAHAQGTVFTYQGQVLDNGTNFNGTGQFQFALVTSTNVASQAGATANPPTGGFITAINVTFGGNGYTTAPAVTISGGGGSGATATATVNSGAVTSVTVHNAGSGYTSTPTVTIAAPPADLAFTTYWSNDGTSVNGSEPVAAVSVEVSTGLFTVALGDTNLANMQAIPAIVFATQPDLQLQIWFNDGVNGFAALSPAQDLTATPYAIQALNASNLLGTFPAAQLSGPVASANLAGAYGNAVTLNNASNQLTGSFTGNGAGLTNLNAWELTGNSGTSPTNGDFVGTTDNNPLELRVNQSRALRLEPDTNNFGAPNVIGGAPNNFVDPGIIGATIAGGGVLNYTAAGAFEPGPGSNHVAAIWGTIGGGRRNTVAADHSFIGGGHDNLIEELAYDSAIGGGAFNTINSSDSESVIAGGQFNSAGGYASSIGGGIQNAIQGTSLYATIGGGGNNTIQGDAYATIGGGEFHTIAASRGTIAGGDHNTINAGADWGAIGGGQFNTITNSQFSDIGGGVNNTIQGDAEYATIAGGELHTILASRGTIAGGDHNTIGVGADWGAIGGGQFNIITNSGFSDIGGGQGNVIQSAADHATIGGGGNNTITGSALLPVYSTIGGGEDNSILTNSIFSVIGGGSNNSCSGEFATVPGGIANLVSGDYATVGGGSGNIASGEYATVPGGIANLAQGTYSFAAGNSAQALHQGAFVWADSSGPGFPSERNDQFRVHANGGVRLDLDDTTSIITRVTTTNWVEFFAQNLGSLLSPNNVVINTSTGANLSSGGSWVNSSDRKLKENFEPVNGREALEKVAALPITRWNYKVEGQSVQHIGPVAQDFQAVFKLSADDKHIATIDEGGVALAAIQGLNQKLEQVVNAKDGEIQTLKRQNDSLTARLNELEATVRQLAARK